VDDCGECAGVVDVGSDYDPFEAVGKENEVIGPENSFCIHSGDKNCSTLSDDCGFTHNCGTCSQPTPVCDNNVCICGTEAYDVGCDSDCNNPPTVVDCWGVCGGDAVHDDNHNTDNCPDGHCIEGDSTNSACIEDCDFLWYDPGTDPQNSVDCFGVCGDPSGPNDVDAFGNCCLADSRDTYYEDADCDYLGDGIEGRYYCAGSEPADTCDSAGTRWVSNNADCPNNNIDACGTCIDGSEGGGYVCCNDFGVTVCNSGETDVCISTTQNYDCDGNCCTSSNTSIECESQTLVIDCTGTCNGNSENDECGCCGGSGIPNPGAAEGEDCGCQGTHGVGSLCGGSFPTLDSCLICGGSGPLYECCYGGPTVCSSEECVDYCGECSDLVGDNGICNTIFDYPAIYIKESDNGYVYNWASYTLTEEYLIGEVMEASSFWENPNAVDDCEYCCGQYQIISEEEEAYMSCLDSIRFDLYLLDDNNFRINRQTYFGPDTLLSGTVMWSAGWRTWWPDDDNFIPGAPYNFRWNKIGFWLKFFPPLS
jgi:hypothetical protein